MGYLNYLPKFEYNLKSIKTTVRDIFRRIAFTQKTRSNSSNYNEMFSETIYTPDQLAHKEYNEAEYYWQILMMNNHISEEEFPDSFQQYSETINKMESGKSLFFLEFFGSEPKIGDVVYSITSGNDNDFTSGGIVSDYDADIRKIDIGYEFGEGLSLAGCTASLYGKNESGLIFKGDLQYERETSVSSSLAYFLDGSGRQCSPYFIPSSTGLGGTFGDPLSESVHQDTLLYKYITNELLPFGFEAITEYKEYSSNEMIKRNIKMPPRQMAETIDRDAQLLLRGKQYDTITTTGLITKVGSTTTTTE